VLQYRCEPRILAPSFSKVTIGRILNVKQYGVRENRGYWKLKEEATDRTELTLQEAMELSEDRPQNE